MIEVQKINNLEDQETAWAIRREVFVIGQDCPEELEWEFEEESVHFLAKINGEPTGTARWRRTENGVKLERFAVLEGFRGRGVAMSLIRYLLNDISQFEGKVYLHAQLTAAGLYEKAGFERVGEHFMEAGIEHVKMELKGR